MEITYLSNNDKEVHLKYVISFLFFTANVSKQMMQKLLLRKFRAHSICLPDMKPIVLGATPKTRDDLVYTYVNSQYHLFKVTEIDDECYICKEFNVTAKNFRRHPNLDFGKVGIFRNFGFKTTVHRLKWSEIRGKVICIGSLLMSVPKNVLVET